MTCTGGSKASPTAIECAGACPGDRVGGECRLPASTVYTDEFRAYDGLGQKGYSHDRVNHSQKVYVSGDVHTNTIEGFWATMKRGIGGTYHAVSTRQLQSYLDEYAFRYNNREATGRGMFDAFLSRIEKASPA